MKKHKFNIFPEAKAEDYNEIRDDIDKNGFDSKRPVTIYQGEILDGWNRQKACDELGITPAYSTFIGTEMEALEFVLSTNRRRNLNSGQRATVAAEAEEIIRAIRDEVAKNVGGRPRKEDAKTWPCHHCGGEHEIGKNPCHGWKEGEPSTKLETGYKPPQKIVEVSKPRQERETATKTAELFNTNRTYVNQAVKMRKEAPEVFEKVKAGKMTMQDANKAVRAIPTDPWLDDEKERKAEVLSGKTVHANQQRDKNLIQWAEKEGLAVRVDRGSKFGNPFILGDDGDRDTVCDAYENSYLPNKPSILKALPTLKGRVLICHCYPERCHAQGIIKRIY
jgi:hypothetical protein